MTDGHRESLISLAEALGLNERERDAFVAGRDGPSVPGGDVFDEMVRTFRATGLNEAQARMAAIGRSGSETEARRQSGEARSQGGGELPPLTGEQRTRLLTEVQAVATEYRSMGASEITARRWAVRTLEEQLNRSDVPPDRRADRAATYMREFATVVREGQARGQAVSTARAVAMGERGRR